MKPSLQPPILVIFGITGDLSKRKLLPALYHLFSQNILPEDTTIIGVSRHDISIDDLLESVELCVLEKDNICDPNGLNRMRAAMTSFRLDPANADDFAQLSVRLSEIDPESAKTCMFYMSVPPSAYGPIVQQLATAGLNKNNHRLLLEKPFGYDSSSSADLIALLQVSFPENQVYRIDHYLAKETAQNLIDFRAYNPVFTSLWNGEHISQVEVRALENIGIENRASFYENTGALRDIIQSHLLQLLAITLMDLPGDGSSEHIHRSKQYFLEQLLPADPHESLRGQYEGYCADVTNPDSTTETYARVVLRHAAERWAGTEFILETGKATAKKTTDIILTFRAPEGKKPNKLIFRLQPDEGINFNLIIKQPGLQTGIHHTALKFDYDQTFDASTHIDAYERVLVDALQGDRSLFASNQEVTASWAVLQPLLDDWKDNNQDMITYPVGADSTAITQRKS